MFLNSGRKKCLQGSWAEHKYALKTGDVNYPISQPHDKPLPMTTSHLPYPKVTDNGYDQCPLLFSGHTVYKLLVLPKQSDPRDI